MKQHFNQALLYDDNCPLCAAYTSAFVKTGMLDANKRISFSKINRTDYAIDYDKARHEIPLVNLKNGEVKYGVDALAEILNQRFIFVKPALKIGCVNWFFKKLYRVISYNRKIIVAKPNVQKICSIVRQIIVFGIAFILLFSLGSLLIFYLQMWWLKTYKTL